MYSQLPWPMSPQPQTPGSPPSGGAPGGMPGGGALPGGIPGSGGFPGGMPGGGGFPGGMPGGGGFPGGMPGGGGFPGGMPGGGGFPGGMPGGGGFPGGMPGGGGFPGGMPGGGGFPGGIFSGSSTTGSVPPPAPSGAQITPDGSVVPSTNGEESYVENILRMNLGKVGTFYMTFENNTEWNAKIFKGLLEAAGRDHIIISDPTTGRRYLLLMLNLDYVTFDEPLVYTLPFGTGPGGPTRDQ